MIDHRLIRQAMRKVLLGVEGIPDEESGQYAVENRTFTPPNPVALWIEETYIVGTEKRVATSTIYEVGVMQYNLFYPQGKGTELLEDLARVIQIAFKPGTVISPTDPQVVTMRAARREGSLSTRHNQAWYMLPVWITIHCWNIADDN